MHPNYFSVKTYNALAIKGNHDTDWDTQLIGWPKQWRRDYDGFRIVGLDNSQDTFCAADWDIINNLPDDNIPTFIAVHKALSTIVLPDGSETTHVMGEGTPNADAQKLQDWLEKRGDAFLLHGHYHGLS